MNKLDNNEQHLLYDFYELGLGEPIGISAGQAKGLGDVLDEIVKLTGKYETEEKEEAGEENAGWIIVVIVLGGGVIARAIAWMLWKKSR